MAESAVSGVGAVKGFTHESHAAITTTWLTPRPLIERLGPFDLDPCAASEPRPWATAKRHIALPEDGLSAAWEGMVWCNPPYGRAVGAWMARMVEHGNGIALVFARTDTAWFEWMASRCSAILFMLGRVKFCRPDGVPAMNASAPSILVAFGGEAKRRLTGSGVPGVVWQMGQRS